MLQRPRHLDRRQVQGRAFSEPLQIRRITTTFNDYGEHQDAFTSFDTVCASHPIDLIREKTRGGVEPKGEIVFYTIEDLRPVDERSSSGDIVIYKGERYRIVSTKRWGSFSASVGERQENQ